MDKLPPSQLPTSIEGENELVYTYRAKVFNFQLHPKVAKPNYYSFFLAENLEVGKAESVLDIGTGSGFFALLLAGTSQVYVSAVDSNPFAVNVARANAQMNGLERRVRVELGDLFTPFQHEKFDLIVCNPPFTPIPFVSIEELRKTDQSLYSNSYGGIDGREIITRIIAQSQPHLNAGGRLIFVHPDYIDIPRTIQELNQFGFESRIVSQRQFPLGSLGTLQKPYIESVLGFRFITGTDGIVYQVVAIVEGSVR